jgi:hypothetical protein
MLASVITMLPASYCKPGQGLNFITAIAIEWEQNAVDHCDNDSNFLPYSAIFILFTVHYYFDTWIQMLIKSCVNHYFSLSFLKKTLKKYEDMFLACQKSKVTIKLKFYYSNLKNAMAIFNAIAVDWFQGNSRPEPGSETQNVLKPETKWPKWNHRNDQNKMNKSKWPKPLKGVKIQISQI